VLPIWIVGFELRGAENTDHVLLDSAWLERRVSRSPVGVRVVARLPRAMLVRPSGREGALWQKNVQSYCGVLMRKLRRGADAAPLPTLRI